MTSKRRIQSKTRAELLMTDKNGEKSPGVFRNQEKKNEEEDLTSYKEDSSEFSSKVSSKTQNNTEMELCKKNLLVAILSKDMEALPRLIDEVIKHTNTINYRDGKEQETLLHKCANQSVPIPIAKMLLEKGARIDARDVNKASPLHIAAGKGNIDLVNFFIANGADPMKKDKHNRIALHKAARGGHLEVIEILLNNNTLINHKDLNGYSALHVAVQFEKVPVIEYLVQHGADILSQTIDGERPIDMLPKYFLDKKKPNKISYSREGKKIYKFLKRKGGQKTISHMGSRLNVGDGKRSHSIDHRSYSMTHDIKVNERTVEPDELSFETSSEEEKSSELLSAKCEETMEKISNAPRVDRRGFLITGDDSNNSNSKKVNEKKSKKKSEKEEKRALKWIGWFNDWDNIFEKNRPKILKYCDYGIPDSVRGTAWKLLSGISVEGRDNELYHKLLEQNTWEKATKDQIVKDIHRTMPGHILFEEKGQGRQMLTNVLLAYSMYNPEVGYCQGMGFITAMFLMYMTEEDAFWLLDAVADSYGLAGLWKVGMIQVRQCMQTLSKLMENYTPKILDHLNEMGIPSITYVPQFFMTGFLYSLPFDMVVRIWDSFWLRRFDYFYAVATSIFKITQPVVLQLEMDQVMLFLKFKDGGRELDFDVEQLIEGSTTLFSKLKPLQLREWEREARENIVGVKETTSNVSKPKKSPRGLVKKFSSSITHSATPRTKPDSNSASESVSIHKPNTRKTRKTATAGRKHKTSSMRTDPIPTNSDESNTKNEEPSTNVKNGTAPIPPPRRRRTTKKAFNGPVPTK